MTHRTLRRTVATLAALSLLLLGAGGITATADAAGVSCGYVSGGEVTAESSTTTCGLARSAARDWWSTPGMPRRIYGYSTKRGRTYTLTHYRSWDDGAIYRGWAGNARLVVGVWND